MSYCKYMDNGSYCRHGCTRIHGEARIVCHRWRKGCCFSRGYRCKRGYHSLPTIRPSSCSAKRPATEPRGDGFRPYISDTEDDKELKKHLRTLGLSTFCEDLLDHDEHMIDAVWRQLAKHRHPDKKSTDGANNAMVQLTNARDFVKARMPFLLH